MKLSVKLLEHHHHNHEQNHQITPQQLHLRAKIPITIFDLPFISHFATTTNSRINENPSDLSLSLSTNFVSGPSLKLTYNTTKQPLTLSLKSGTGLFGSPNNSPLLISAHFSFNPGNNSPNPTFSLVFKPRFGSFSLRKSTLSHGNDQGSVSRSDSPEPNSFGFVPLERPTIPVNEGLGNAEKGLLLGDNNVDKGSTLVNDHKGSIFENNKDSIYKGFNLLANTEMPVFRNKVSLNVRWRVGFGKDDMPVLRINKIGIHKIDDVFSKKVSDDDGDERKRTKKKEGVINEDELEFLKGMCGWMKREVDVLARANRDMRFELEEMKKAHVGFGDRVSKPTKKSSIENGGGFEQWRNKRNGGNEEKIGNVDRKKEEKKNGNSLSVDVENELERAIKAASFSSPP